VTRFCEAPGINQVGGTKNPDIDAIAALRPDVVLMDREENRRPDAEALQQRRLRVVATHVTNVDDVPAALDALATAVGFDRSETSGPACPADHGPIPPPLAVFVPIWRRPWMTLNSGTYGSSVLGRSGFVNVYAGSADPYPTVTLEDATGRQPRRVLAPSEPYAFAERHRRELEPVAPVTFVDGQDLFWWGVRTPGAIRRLRAQLHRIDAAVSGGR
jgi:hypothetical protein